MGDAYEYDRPFAAGSGKKRGLVLYPATDLQYPFRHGVTDGQEPSTGKQPKLDQVLDFACGSGSLLLNVRRRMGRQGVSKLFGQEKNITNNLARMNMLLHGLKDTEFEIFHGDTLLNEEPQLREENPAKKRIRCGGG